MPRFKQAGSGQVRHIDRKFSEYHAAGRPSTFIGVTQSGGIVQYVPWPNDPQTVQWFCVACYGAFTHGPACPVCVIGPTMQRLTERFPVSGHMENG